MPGLDGGGRFSWHTRAECARRGLDTELFYPASADPDRWDPRVRDACANCAVHAKCLAWAMDHGELGIWADTDEHGRARTRRANRRRPR